MRRITAALLLTTCLAAGESLWAQNGEPTAEPQQASTQQTSSADDNKTYSNDKTRHEQDKKTANAQSAQSNCAPDANPVSEGDPDAPQNRVEYGGGG
jgi:hypothetical protein